MHRARPITSRHKLPVNSLIQLVTLNLPGSDSGSIAQLAAQLQDLRHALLPSASSLAVPDSAFAAADATNVVINCQIDAFCDQLRGGNVQGALMGFARCCNRPLSPSRKKPLSYPGQYRSLSSASWRGRAGGGISGSRARSCRTSLRGRRRDAVRRAVPAPGEPSTPQIAEAFDWFGALSGCPQDPVFHAEGDRHPYADGDGGAAGRP